MPAFRSVVSVLVRALGDFSLHPQGRPCGRPPAAAVLGRHSIPLAVVTMDRTYSSIELDAVAASYESSSASPTV
jgi:hypothetical protein